jgi:hypothetical protein
MVTEWQFLATGAFLLWGLVSSLSDLMASHDAHALRADRNRPEND